MLLLGLALAVAEECIIQQTSLAPLVGVDPDHAYGRSLGVNWPYFLWALGYESIWVVLLPVQLVELIFPERRDETWLRSRGLVISAVVFALASFFAWFTWTQLYLPSLPQAPYHVPLSSIGLAVVAIVLLSAVALGPFRLTWQQPQTTRPAPAPPLVGLAAFMLALPWFALIFLAYGVVPNLPVAIPMTLGVALAVVAFGLIARWVARSRVAGFLSARAHLRSGRRQHDCGIPGVRSRRGSLDRRHRQVRLECHRGCVADPYCPENLGEARSLAGSRPPQRAIWSSFTASASSTRLAGASSGVRLVWRSCLGLGSGVSSDLGGDLGP